MATSPCGRVNQARCGNRPPALNLFVNGAKPHLEQCWRIGGSRAQSLCGTGTLAHHGEEDPCLGKGSPLQDLPYLLESEALCDQRYDLPCMPCTSSATPLESFLTTRGQVCGL